MSSDDLLFDDDDEEGSLRSGSGDRSRSISRARKELGAAGRRELAGFEHLIKSLRVNATLDLAPNLVEELVQPTSSKPRKVDEGKARRPRQGKGDWPLPLQELPAPMYPFSDEIRRVASRVLAQELDSLSDGIPSVSPDFMDTFATREQQLVAQAFDLLYTLRPRLVSDGRGGSRRSTLSWETFLAKVASTGLVDSNVVDKTYERMKELIGANHPAPTTGRGVSQNNQNDGPGSFEDEVGAMDVKYAAVKTRSRTKAMQKEKESRDLRPRARWRRTQAEPTSGNESEE